MSGDQIIKYVLIEGYKPAYSKAVNNFLASLDLGISGAYVPDTYIIMITFNSDLTPEKHDRLLEALEEFHENEGWKEVKVKIFDGNKPDKKETKSAERNPYPPDRYGPI